MPDLRASRIGAEYDPERGDPILVFRDSNGVLRTFTNYERAKASFVSGNLKGFGDLLILHAEEESNV